MVLTIIIVVGLLLVVGIFLLNSGDSTPKVTRLEYLQKLAKYTEGRLEAMVEVEDSYQVFYDFEGANFVFEDIRMKGFKNAVFRAHLKTNFPFNYTLTFGTKQTKSRVKMDVVMISKVDHNIQRAERLKMPPEFKSFDAFSNDVSFTNLLFEDKKFVGIIKNFISINTKGVPYVSFRVIQGEMVLDFHEFGAARPSLAGLKANVSLIEKYTDQLWQIVQLVKERRKG